MIRLAGLAGAARKLVVDNGPTILTAMAVFGVASTAVMAVKATPKALKIIEVAESKGDILLTPQEKLRLIAPCYISASVVGVGTVACIIGANSVHLKRQAALISAYSLVESRFQDYQAKVTETMGKNKEQKVRDELAQDQVNNNPISNNGVIITGHGDHLFMDSLSSQYFESTYEKVKRAENDLNRKLLHEMYVSLNDFYDLLGIQRNNLGEELGWKTGTDVELSVSATTIHENGTVRACLVLNYSVEPIRKYYKLN
jgi:hypothetical protein